MRTNKIKGHSNGVTLFYIMDSSTLDSFRVERLAVISYIVGSPFLSTVQILWVVHSSG